MSDLGRSRSTGTLAKGGAGRRNAAAWIALGLALSLGFWLRLTDLDRAPFSGDELDHYYAARSLADGEGPSLPSGNEYLRGIDLTRIVSLTYSFVEEPGAVARLPSAAFGCLSLILIAVIAWRLGGPWAAVWAAGLLGVYPEAVLQSRQIRFYTYQLCYGLVALYAGWRAIDPNSSPEGARRWLWLAVAVVAFLGAARVQPTTLSVICGWYATALVVAARELRLRGRSAWKTNAAPAVIGLGLMAGVSLMLFAPSFLETLLARATDVPAWAGAGGDTRAYFWALSQAFPVVLTLAPVSYLVVASRRPWLSLYLCLWFAVPFALHSFLLPWKAERYVFLAIPGLLLATSLAASDGIGALLARVRRSLEEARPSWHRGRISAIAAALVALAGVYALTTSRAFNQARRLPTPQQPRYWTTALQIIRDRGLEHGRLGSSQPLVALHYWGRVDFAVGVDFLDAPGEGADETGLKPEGSPDWYAGVPILTVPASIRSRFPEARDFLIGIDLGRWDHGNIAPALRETLLAEAEELCENRCGAMLLFRWRPAEGPDDATASTGAQGQMPK